MESEKHGKKTPENPPILGIEKLASATECTGLTPAAIQTPGQAENYTELYAIHEQKTAWEDDSLGASEDGRHSKRKQ